MGGGLMQLVAYGAQDIYLTGNPQITFFKVVYRRHTNFSMECIEQVFSGTPDFGRKAMCTITRNGDLVTRMYLKVDLPALGDGTCWVRRVGYAMIKHVEVEIGGTRIDKHYGTWMNVWHELSRNSDHDRAHDRMVGNDGNAQTLAGATSARTLYVPLQFWFCRNTGLALPLIALQYHEVRVNFEFETAANLQCGAGEAAQLQDASLLVDYIYLDSEERRRFAQVGHEYLIEQLQFTGADSVSGTTHKSKLNFNHPVKELVWVVQDSELTSGVNVMVHPQAEGALDSLAVAMVEAAVQANAADAVAAGNTLAFDADGTQSVGGVSVTMEVNGGGNVKVDTTSLQGKVSDVVLVVDNNGGEVTVVSVTHSLTSADLDTAGGVTFRDPLLTSTNLDGTANPIVAAKLQLNGHDRFSERDGDYFNYVQPMQHHSNTPADGVNVYSFALKPEEHQPSGSCNMSRIDNAQLNVNLVDFEPNHNHSRRLSVFGVNYNVLRIMSGMGGLAYSN